VGQLRGRDAPRTYLSCGRAERRDVTVRIAGLQREVRIARGLWRIECVGGIGVCGIGPRIVNDWVIVATDRPGHDEKERQVSAKRMQVHCSIVIQHDRAVLGAMWSEFFGHTLRNDE
jgi:hypothetical protein